MSWKLSLIGIGIALFGATVPAFAHFQLLYVDESARIRGAAAHLGIVFTHPFSGGPTMEMEDPDGFYMLQQRGDDAEIMRTELAQYLTPVTWSGIGNQGAAFEAEIPANIVRSLGDYVFVLEPSPYYEEGEDKYIQQFTKMVMNVGGVPGNWAEEVGLPTEILPLNKPYANWTGGVFRGIVLSGGEPVPFAEIEIEYVNHALNFETHSFAEQAAIDAPHPAFENMSIKADANGQFSIGLPRAGWWGICALAVGPVTEYEGKPLSQDAVLWVQAHDIAP